MPNIEILNVIYDGYERLYTIRFCEGYDKILWAHGIEHGEYIDSGSNQYNPPRKANATFFIEWVLETKQADKDRMLMFNQDIKNSSHVQCIGTVIKKIDNDSFCCKIPILGEIVVEFEKSYTDISENMNIEFLGNLAIELI